MAFVGLQQFLSDKVSVWKIASLGYGGGFRCLQSRIELQNQADHDGLV